MGLLEGELPDWVHRRAREGCRTAISVVTNRHRGLVRVFARKYRRGKADIPIRDHYASARLGLVIAARKHDPSRSPRFSTTASWWVRSATGECAASHRRWFCEPNSALLMGCDSYIASYSKGRRNSAQESPLVNHMGRNVNGPDLYGAKCYSWEQVHGDRSRPKAEAAVAALPWGTLTDEEIAVVRDIYMAGATNIEAARPFNRAGDWARRKGNSALAKLRSANVEGASACG